MFQTIIDEHGINERKHKHNFDKTSQKTHTYLIHAEHKRDANNDKRAINDQNANVQNTGEISFKKQKTINSWFNNNHQEAIAVTIAKDTRKKKDDNESIAVTIAKDTRKRKDDESITDIPCIKKNKSMNQNPGISINQDITKYFIKKNKTNISEMASSSNELSAYGPTDTTNFVSNLGFIPNSDEDISVLNGDFPHDPRLDFAPPQPGSRRYNPSIASPPQPGSHSPPARIASEVLAVFGPIPPADLAPHYLEHPT
jgi:hypothetical protein